MRETILNDLTSQRIIFHFNKKYLEDPTIPMWVIKHKGKTYYVDHIESSIGFHTKNTPDNEATKGSLQFKGIIEIVKEDGEATAYITKEDKA